MKPGMSISGHKLTECNITKAPRRPVDKWMVSGEPCTIWAGSVAAGVLLVLAQQHVLPEDPALLQLRPDLVQPAVCHRLAEAG